MSSIKVAWHKSCSWQRKTVDKGPAKSERRYKRCENMYVNQWHQACNNEVCLIIYLYYAWRQVGKSLNLMSHLIVMRGEIVENVLNAQNIWMKKYNSYVDTQIRFKTKCKCTGLRSSSSKVQRTLHSPGSSASLPH